MTKKEEKVIKNIKTANELNFLMNKLSNLFIYLFPFVTILSIVLDIYWGEKPKIGGVDIIIISAVYSLYFYIRKITETINNIIKQFDNDG